MSHQYRPFVFRLYAVQIQDPTTGAGFLGPLLVLIILFGFSEKAEPEYLCVVNYGIDPRKLER